MRGNLNKARRPISPLNCDGSPETFLATSVWFGKSPSARLDEEGTPDQGGCAPNPSIASDDDYLLMRAQSGEQQAFVELCRRHSPMVNKRIFSIVRNQEDAEDALQDTLLRAFRHLGAFRRTCKFSTWLTSIGTNTALMILRKRKTRKEGHIDILNDGNAASDATEFVDLSLDPERLHSRHQIILVMRQEVEKLRPTLRSIIEQHYGTECSLEESAKAFDISVGAAKSRLMRGRKTLRWYLRRRGVSDSRV
jgi:RNA polymerase sigma-70 factor (ECF subfamily)